VHLGFVWPPPEDPKYAAEGGPLPLRSPQIFRDSLDEDTIRRRMSYDRPGVDKKYGIAEFVATTIENRAYGVKANQVSVRHEE